MEKESFFDNYEQKLLLHIDLDLKSWRVCRTRKNNRRKRNMLRKIVKSLRKNLIKFPVLIHLGIERHLLQKCFLTSCIKLILKK